MALISKNKLAGDILFIGVGLGGCRVVNAIQLKGYECYYINTAIGDFDALTDVANDMVYPVPKAKGCDKDMDLAMEMVGEYIDDIYNKIYSNYSKYQHIYFVFSAGGGTGAGSAPAMAEYFARTFAGTKTVGLIIILPSKDDNALSSANALRCLQYIEENCPSVTSKILLDNEQEDKFVINSAFADQIDNLLSLPENNVQQTRVLKSADERETLGLLATKKYIHISTISAPSKKSGSTEPYIIESVKYIPKPDVRECVSIAVSISESTQEDFNPDNLYKCYGRPIGDIKAGFNNSSVSYAYVFGTEFPTYLPERYNQWLDEFEEDKNSVELKKANFGNVAKRDFLNRQTKTAITTSSPFARPTTPSRDIGTRVNNRSSIGRRTNNLPELTENPFKKK